MKVSVVIPVYNSAKYLKKCLDSIINQTYQNREIIVVYDDSQDRTYEILDEYRDKIIVVEKNSGSETKALNDGIDAVTGDWIMYVGSDDILYPNAIEELINESKKVNNQKFILYSNYEVIDSSGNILRKFIEPNFNHLEKKDFDVILLDHYFGNFSCSLIHKSLFEKYGQFDKKYALVIDYELWLRFVIIHECRLHLVSKVLFQYRQQKNSVTQTNVDQCVKDAENLIPQFLSRLSPKLRNDYEQKLKKYKKNKPLKYKIKLMIKNILFVFLPHSLQKSIYNKYLSRKSF